MRAIALIIVLSFILVIGILGALGIIDTDSPDENIVAEQTAEQPIEQAEEQTAEELRPEDREAVKAAAREVDKKIWSMVLASEKINKLLTEGMQYAGSGASLLDLYDFAKTAKQKQQAVFSALIGIPDEAAGEYTKAAEYYASNGMSIAGDIMKYIDKQEMKYLSRAKESLVQNQNILLEILHARMMYLTSQGYTDEEIYALLDSEAKE